ncbi:MAG: dNTP triphosphohydrolase, partial [Planctomycetota bacterium]
MMMSEAQSRGRLHPDHDSPYRGVYQRDRDRIVHSSAFRRLQYKTQVFISVMEGDYFRNRLTHTLEVTQIARTIARALALNEDLAEALALAHDLGHGPFGHSGEDALNEVMRDFGGFDHNAQGLRIVDRLETRYARFPGLNLSYETREGYAKNYVARDGSPRSRSLLGFAANEMPTLEVQLVSHADEIAYDTHDLDDGLVSGALVENDVRCVSLWRDTEAQVLAEDDAYKTDHRMRWHAIVRRLIATLVTDLMQETQRRISDNKIESVSDVRNFDGELTGFSPEMSTRKRELEHFLMQRFYKSAVVKERTDFWRERLKQLFRAYRSTPALLPDEIRKRIDTGIET